MKTRRPAMALDLSATSVAEPPPVEMPAAECSRRGKPNARKPKKLPPHAVVDRLKLKRTNGQLDLAAGQSLPTIQEMPEENFQRYFSRKAAGL
jgi:hypothetical protein